MLIKRTLVVDIKQSTTPLIKIKTDYSIPDQETLRTIRIKKPDNTFLIYNVTVYEFNVLIFRITNVNDLSLLGLYSIVGYTIDSGDYISITETGLFNVVPKFYVSTCKIEDKVKTSVGLSLILSIEDDLTGWTITGDLLYPDLSEESIDGIYNNGNMVFQFESDTLGHLGKTKFVSVAQNGTLILISDTVVFDVVDIF